MTRRRQRRRASDIADIRPKKGLGAAFLLAVGLGLVIAYKVGVGEETAGFIAQVTGDPGMKLPPSVLDRLDLGPAPPDAAPEPAPAADAARDAGTD